LGIAPGVGRRQLDYSGGIGMAGSDEKCSSEENYNPSLSDIGCGSVSSFVHQLCSGSFS
jgi:hypothetical protein